MKLKMLFMVSFAISGIFTPYSYAMEPEEATSLHTLAEQRKTSIIQKRIDERSVAYAELNQRRPGDNQGLAHIAVRTNNIALLELLLANHANFNLQDKLGNTPFHLALIVGNLVAAQLIALTQYRCFLANPNDIFINPFIRNRNNETVHDCAVNQQFCYREFKALLYTEYGLLHASIRKPNKRHSDIVIYREGDPKYSILHDDVAGKTELVIKYHENLYCLIRERQQRMGPKAWAYVNPIEIIQVLNVLEAIEEKIRENTRTHHGFQALSDNTD